MRRVYDFPRSDSADAYLEICARARPPLAEEGGRIGVEELALILRLWRNSGDGQIGQLRNEVKW